MPRGHIHCAIISGFTKASNTRWRGARLYEAGALQHLEVARHRGQRHVERLRQLAHRRLAARQARKERTSCGIRKGGEGGRELVHRGSYLTDMLNTSQGVR